MRVFCVLVFWQQDTIPEFGSGLSMGTAAGFCSGVLLRKLGRAAATLVGVSFVALTLADRQGYIAINWDKVTRDGMAAVDSSAGHTPFEVIPPFSLYVTTHLSPYIGDLMPRPLMCG